MANNEGRTCPKCGMNLGQKHLCPVCDKPAQNRIKSEEPRKTVAESGARTSKSAGKAAASDAAVDTRTVQTSVERFRQYKQLKKSLADNPADFTFALQTVRTILTDYADYFELDYINFFMDMYRAKCPFAVFAVLMDPKWNKEFRKLLACEYKQEKATKKVVFSFAPSNWPFEFQFPSSDAFLQFDYSSSLNLTIWGKDFSQSVDQFHNATRKPIKMAFVQGCNNWAPLENLDKKILILYQGTFVNVRSPDQAHDNAKGAKKTKAEDPEVFSMLNGLQCCSEDAVSSRSNSEFVLLYLVTDREEDGAARPVPSDRTPSTSRVRRAKKKK